MSIAPPVFARRDGEDWLLAVKVVPGASRCRIHGILGDRLKIHVQAIAEDGKANRAVEKCIALWLKCNKQQVHIEQGLRNPLKTARVTQLNELPPL